MKKFTLLSLFLCLAYFAQAQIVINSSDITFDTMGHTFYYTDVKLNTVAVPQGGADVLWDYSTIQPDGSSYPIVYESVSDPNYPRANCRRIIDVAYLSGTVPIYRYHRFDATGFSIIGYEEATFPFPLGSVTGSPADTLFHVGGPRIESQGQLIFNLPMAYGDTSHTENISDFLLRASVAAFGLNNFLIKQRIRHNIDLEVIGWGKLALRNPTTLMVDTFETLLNREIQIRTDSFVDANNNPLPANFLAPLGLSQNQIYTTVVYSFFVKGVNHFAFRVVTDNINGPITTSLFNDELFTLGTPVSTSPKNNITTKHQIYPNPIQNHQFQLEIEKNNGENWQLDICNILGQSVHNELIINNISTIELSKNLPSGQYFYTVRNENGETVANGKLMK